MSFKLFFASTFGLIKSTAKIEAEYDSLLKDYQSYSNFENSAEHKEYHELDLLVSSPTFKQKKKEIQGLKLKGSKEAAQLAELKKLARKKKLQLFYTTLTSEDLKRFDKISASELLSKYNKLKSLVESPSFDNKKKTDETTDEYVKFQEFQKLKESDDLKFYNRFAASSSYKNYLAMKESPERKRHDELQKITTSEEFKARLAYLEDQKKWEKTEESAKENRLEALKKLPELAVFLKYKNSNAFDFFKKWDMVFEDRFESKKLDESKWLTKSHWANQTIGQNFSQIGDLQAFTDGKNISVDGNSLKIDVRKEKAKGMQWQMPFGFVENEFDYTSGVISTAGTDWWNHGILEAKVKYSPSKHFVDAIYLLGEERSPQINLVEMGVQNRLGTLTQINGDIKADCESISGLKAGEFYIFRLEWTAHSLIWKINGREMLSINLHVPSHSMHLNATSIVVSEPDGSLPHQLEIGWVRFYQHRQHS